MKASRSGAARKEVDQEKRQSALHFLAGISLHQAPAPADHAKSKPAVPLSSAHRRPNHHHHHHHHHQISEPHQPQQRVHKDDAPSQQPSPRGAPSGLQEPVADTAGEGAKAADPPESKGDETARNKDRYQVAGWCARISHVAWVRCAAAREGVSVLPAIPLTEAYVGPCALTSLRRCLSSF
jgi:hypothetical protein